MINDIVEMILKEARGRNRKYLADAIFYVETDIEFELVKIKHALRKEERRGEEDENKRRDIKGFTQPR